VKLRAKLQIFSILPASLLIVVGGVSLGGFWLLHQEAEELYFENMLPVQELKLVSDGYAVDIIDATNKAIAGTLTTAEALQYVEQAQEQIRDNWSSYQQHSLEADEEAVTERIAELLPDANRQVERLVEVLASGDRDRLQALNTSLYRAIDPLSDELQALIEVEIDLGRQRYATAQRVYTSILWFFVPLLTLAIVLVVSPLRVLLSRAIIATLEKTIAGLASATQEIDAATSDHESVASQQASSVEETAAVMERLGRSSQESAEQAKMASERAEQVLALAHKGNAAVADTLAGMAALQEQTRAIAAQIGDLESAARQIGNISQIVSELADQTNMLALNASIEAVRAGEQGRGFAVVAAEIRKLAEQSQSSASQIGGLVTTIQNAIQATVAASKKEAETVEEGATLAQTTAEAFRGVATAIEEVVRSSQNIFITVQEEASAIEQVSQAVNDLKHAARNTASSIRQTKVGTQQLNTVALDLQDMI